MKLAWQGVSWSILALLGICTPVNGQEPLPPPATLSGSVDWQSAMKSAQEQAERKYDCPVVSDCYQPRRQQEAVFTAKRLTEVVDKTYSSYLKNSAALRRKFAISNKTVTDGRFADQSYQSSAHTMLVGFGHGGPPATKPAFDFLLKYCATLSDDMYLLGLGGLHTYVNRVMQGIEADSRRGTAESLNNSFHSTDSMYSTINKVKSNLSVSPDIKSIPTGAQIGIQTRLQEENHKFEFLGSTDTKGFNLYRGIYIYTVSAHGGAVTVGELNLIDAPGNLVFCSKENNTSTLLCEAR